MKQNVSNTFSTLFVWNTVNAPQYFEQTKILLLAVSTANHSIYIVFGNLGLAKMHFKCTTTKYQWFI